MPFAPLYELCPDVAKRETRAITVTPAANSGLPAGDYGFVEMYCNEPKCDCRRVFFSVLSSNTNQIEAVIAWGWEDVAFYKRWLGGLDPKMARDMQGPVLNFGSPQSKFAGALLDLARRTLLNDPTYVERIKTHYALFRSKVDGGAAKLLKGLRRNSRKQ